MEAGETRAHYPDGLTSEVIDALLNEAEASWSTAARPTSRLLVGGVAPRHERRAARRGLGAVVRALPTVSVPADEPADEVA